MCCCAHWLEKNKNQGHFPWRGKTPKPARESFVDWPTDVNAAKYKAAVVVTAAYRRQSWGERVNHPTFHYPCIFVFQSLCCVFVFLAGSRQTSVFFCLWQSTTLCLLCYLAAVLYAAVLPSLILYYLCCHHWSGTTCVAITDLVLPREQSSISRHSQQHNQTAEDMWAAFKHGIIITNNKSSHGWQTFMNSTVC